MEFIDICILIVAIGIVFSVVRYQILKKRSGKSGSCGGGCSGCCGCPISGSCGQNSNIEKFKEESIVDDKK